MRSRNTCSKCKGKLEPQRVGVQRYCLSCHCNYMRKSREERAAKIAIEIQQKQLQISNQIK